MTLWDQINTKDPIKPTRILNPSYSPWDKLNVSSEIQSSQNVQQAVSALPETRPQQSFFDKYNAFSSRLGELGAEMDVGITKSVGGIVGGLSSIGNWILSPLEKAMGQTEPTKNLGDTINTFATELDKHTGVKDKKYLDNLFEGLGTAIPYIAGGAVAKAAQVPSLVASLGIGGVQALSTARDEYHQLVDSGEKNAGKKAAIVFGVDLALNTAAHFLGPLAQGGKSGILPSIGRILKSTALETANYGLGQTIVSNVVNKRAPFSGVWDAVLTMAPISVAFGAAGEAGNKSDVARKQVTDVIDAVAKEGGTKNDAVKSISALSGISEKQVEQSVNKIIEDDPTRSETYAKNETTTRGEDLASLAQEVQTRAQAMRDQGKTEEPRTIMEKLSEAGYDKKQIVKVMKILYDKTPEGKFSYRDVANELNGVKPKYPRKPKGMAIIKARPEKVVPKTKKEATIAKRAFDLTKKNGGVTIKLNGDIPEKGYSFAESKATEHIVPENNWTEKDVDNYIADHFDDFSKGKHLGLWVDEGKVYHDVITVADDVGEALRKADTADQIGIFDLKNFETINTKEGLQKYEKEIASHDEAKTRSNEGGIRQGGETETSGEGLPAKSGEGKKPSKIAKSIEAKAIEQKITKGFGELAGFDPIKIKEQSKIATDLINSDLEKARAMIRGEEPLPDSLKSIFLVNAMEEYALKTGDADVAYELANSPLISETSEAGQILRGAAEREQDSATNELRRLKLTREKKALKATKTKKSEIIKKIREESKKVNLTKDELKWESFLGEISC